MGKILLVGRLAARDLRRHKAQAVLLLLAIAAATAVLALGLALSGVTNQPYQQTRAATKGPDVVGSLDTPGQATALIHASGVTAASGPYPLAYAVLRVNGRMAGAEAEGRTEAPAAVDQPELTAGSWVRPGGVVIERTFAEALGVSVGDRLTLNGQSFTVAGIAVSAAQQSGCNRSTRRIATATIPTSHERTLRMLRRRSMVAAGGDGSRFGTSLSTSPQTSR